MVARTSRARLPLPILLEALCWAWGAFFLITRLKPLMKWLEGRLKQSATRIYVVHAVFVFFLADAYMIFPGIIGILKTTKMVGSMSAK